MSGKVWNNTSDVAAKKCPLEAEFPKDAKRYVDIKVPLLDSWTLRRFVDANHRGGPTKGFDPWCPTVSLVQKTKCPLNSETPITTVYQEDTVVLPPCDATFHLRFPLKTLKSCTGTRDRYEAKAQVQCLNKTPV